VPNNLRVIQLRLEMFSQAGWAHIDESVMQGEAARHACVVMLPQLPAIFKDVLIRTTGIFKKQKEPGDGQRVLQPVGGAQLQPADRHSTLPTRTRLPSAPENCWTPSRASLSTHFFNPTARSLLVVFSDFDRGSSEPDAPARIRQGMCRAGAAGE
jgi:hypothetical protein